MTTPPEAQYAALAQRVTGIENTLAGVSAQISALATAFNERSKTPWGLIFGGGTFFLSVLLAVGGIVAWGLSSQNSNLLKSMDEFRQIYADNRNTSRLDQTARNLSVDTQLSRFVPRDELQQIWTAQQGTDHDQQRQIDEQKSAFGSVFGLKDIIKDLKENQDQLRNQLLTIAKQEK